jgi:hypothetical protein
MKPNSTLSSRAVVCYIPLQGGSMLALPEMEWARATDARTPLARSVVRVGVMEWYVSFPCTTLIIIARHK